MTFLRWHLRRVPAGTYVAFAPGKPIELFDTSDDMVRFFLRSGASRKACDQAVSELTSSTSMEAELRVPRDPVFWVE